MAPTVHLIRHAQGWHNMSVANESIRDPLLTPDGEKQCETLSAIFPYSEKIDMIVASPLKRTIYTAMLSFPSSNLPIVALPELQEISDLPSDTGSPRDEIDNEFRDKKIVDLSHVVDGWDSKQGRWSPSPAAIRERAKVARAWLMEQKADNIAVVSHGGFMHYLTEDWTGSDRFHGTGWANTEFRSYTFDTDSGSNASLIETDESKARRKNFENSGSGAESRKTKSPTTAVGQMNVKQSNDRQRHFEVAPEPLVRLAKV